MPKLAQDRARSAGSAVLVGLAIASLALAGLAGSGAAQAAAGRPASGATPPLQGRGVGEVLTALGRQGLTIVFSDELVPPGLQVATEPGAREPRAVLDEILRQLGLRAEENVPGILVVVRADPSPARLSGAGRVDLRLWQELTIHDAIVVRPEELPALAGAPDAPLALARSEIEREPHLGGDVLRALSLMPGVTANDVTSQPSIHAGRRDEVKILVDGQELYGSTHLQDYDGALGIVPAGVLGGVTLTTGAFPVRYGDRMGGVLDLRTLDSPTRGRRVQLGLSVLDAALSGAGRFAAGRGAWLVSARQGTLAVAERAIGSGRPRFGDLLVKVELDGERFGALSGHVLAARDTLDFTRQDRDSSERLDSHYDGGYGWLSHQLALGNRLVIESSASWAHLSTDREGATDDEEVEQALRDSRDVRVRSLAQAWTLDRGPRHLTTWGWELRRATASFDYARAGERRLDLIAPFSPLLPATQSFRGTLRGEDVALWASDRAALAGDRLTVEAGARYDHHSATGDTLWSPRLNLGWRIGERSVLRAGWGRFTQSDRVYELQVADAETGLHRAERSEQRLLGFERLAAPGRTGWLRLGALRLELFERAIARPRPRYENLFEPVVFLPEAEPDRFRITPQRSGARGVEALARGAAGARCDWRLAYAYSESWDRLGGRRVRRALDQPHSLALNVDLRLARDWSLALAWRLHTGWPTTPLAVAPAADPPAGDAVPVATLGPLNSQRLPLYHRLDLRALRSWNARSGRWTLFVDVQNVYDRRNPAGFNVNVGTDGSIRLEEQRWPGIFPSVGFTWEF